MKERCSSLILCQECIHFMWRLSLHFSPFSPPSLPTHKKEGQELTLRGRVWLSYEDVSFLVCLFWKHSFNSLEISFSSSSSPVSPSFFGMRFLPFDSLFTWMFSLSPFFGPSCLCLSRLSPVAFSQLLCHSPEERKKSAKVHTDGKIRLRSRLNPRISRSSSCSFLGWRPWCLSASDRSQSVWRLVLSSSFEGRKIFMSLFFLLLLPLWSFTPLLLPCLLHYSEWTDEKVSTCERGPKSLFLLLPFPLVLLCYWHALPSYTSAASCQTCRTFSLPLVELFGRVEGEKRELQQLRDAKAERRRSSRVSLSSVLIQSLEETHLTTFWEGGCISLFPVSHASRWCDCVFSLYTFINNCPFCLPGFIFIPQHGIST